VPTACELLVLQVRVVTVPMPSVHSLKLLNDDGDHDDKFAFGCIRYHTVEA
jgi:hypothetical protein